MFSSTNYSSESNLWFKAIAADKAKHLSLKICIARHTEFYIHSSLLIISLPLLLPHGKRAYSPCSLHICTHLMKG